MEFGSQPVPPKKVVGASQPSHKHGPRFANNNESYDNMRRRPYHTCKKVDPVEFKDLHLACMTL